MAGVVISRRVATEPLVGCAVKMYPIAVGDPYCHVDLQPRVRHPGGWGYVDRYCEPCAIEKYARYRRILDKLGSADA
ncbi:hypothetical protein ACX80N_12540 [Arthrobacter sp. MDT2-16]